MLSTRFLHYSILAAVALMCMSCGVLEEQMGSAIKANPVVRSHLGDLTKIEMDLRRTASEPGDEVFAFRVEGTRGAGLVVAEFISVSASEEVIASGSLEMDSGEVYDLMPSSP